MEINRADPNYWKMRAEEGISVLIDSGSENGIPMSIKTPAELWVYACEYFERCDSNPWIRKDFKGAHVKEVEMPTAAPYLWSGFEDYLFEKGVCSTLKDYRTAANKNQEELDERYKRYAPFSEVIRAIGQVMSTQKISGGLVNAYNSNLVARIEDLVDKVEDVSKGATKRPKFVFVNKVNK